MPPKDTGVFVFQSSPSIGWGQLWGHMFGLSTAREPLDRVWVLAVTSWLLAWEEEVVKGPGCPGQCPHLLQPTWIPLHLSTELPLLLLLTCPAFHGVRMYHCTYIKSSSFFLFLLPFRLCVNTEDIGHIAFPLKDVICHIHLPVCVPSMETVLHSGPYVGFGASQTWLCFPAWVSGQITLNHCEPIPSYAYS